VTKDEFERSIFLGFSHVLQSDGSTVALETVRQPGPPSPDIVCRVDGVETGFELTMATTESLHESVALGKTAGGFVGGEALAAFRSKASKRYPGFSGPIDLVIHEGPVADLAFLGPWVDGFCDAVQPVIRTTSFRSVWVVSRDGSRLYIRVSHQNSPPP
jgi:hypothetical protein